MPFEIVTNPYPVSASPLDIWSADDIPSIVVRGDWSTELEAYVRTNKVEGLYFNIARGWAGNDYGFLREFEWLKLVSILTGQKVDLSSLSRVTNLRRLSVTSSGGEPVDFSGLKKLERCFLNWWTGARSIFECESLESLSIDKLPAKESTGLTQLGSLRDLTIYSQSIKSLESISQLENLQKLELNRFRNLESLDGIENLKSLRSLSINECKQLSDLSLLSTLTNLEHLVISDWGTIETLAPIASLKKLRAFSFSGTRTTITDGDLSPLEDLPMLSMLMFASRRHYSHKLVKNWNWNNFDSPDTLLELKKSKKSD